MDVTREAIEKFAKDAGLPGQGLFDYLSRQDELLVANLKLLYELTQVLQGGPGVVAVTMGGAGRGLGIRAEQIISDYKARSTEVIYPVALADCIGASRVLVVVNNGLDMDAVIDIIGNTSNAYDGASVIISMLCQAGEKRAYGLKLEEWMPYVGVQVTPLATPTGGALDARVIIQEAG